MGPVSDFIQWAPNVKQHRLYSQTCTVYNILCLLAWGKILRDTEFLRQQRQFQESIVLPFQLSSLVGAQEASFISGLPWAHILPGGGRKWPQTTEMSINERSMKKKWQQKQQEIERYPQTRVARSRFLKLGSKVGNHQSRKLSESTQEWLHRRPGLEHGPHHQFSISLHACPFWNFQWLSFPQNNLRTPKP